MFFVLLWKTRFFVIEIVDLLSQHISVVPVCCCWRSSNNSVNQIAWQHDKVAAMYSSFEDDKATVSSSFELHETTPEPRLKCSQMFYSDHQSYLPNNYQYSQLIWNLIILSTEFRDLLCQKYFTRSSWLHLGDALKDYA